jgi:hypothetical protein
MKAFVLTSLLLIGSSQLFAGKPPEVVAKAFKQKFPSAINIKWTTDHNNYWMARFSLNNKYASSTFTSDGHWIWGELEKSIKEVREEVKNAINRDHPNCEIISLTLTEYIGEGSWYDVKFKCGNTIGYATYDEKGLPPPKI